MKPLKLSICNYFHNNEHSLPNFFASLERELKSGNVNRESVEVILYDNASTDESSRLAQQICQKIEQAKYFSAVNKVSAEQSLQKAFSFCSGEYVWLIGDDYLYNGALEKVLSALNQKAPDILIANSLLYRSCQSITERNFQNRLDDFPTLTSKLRALGHSYNHFFISNYIGKRQIIQQIANESATQWPHCETLIRYLDSENNKLEIIQSQPIVIESESRWYADPSYCLDARAETLLELVRLDQIPTNAFASRLVQQQAVILFIANFIYLKMGNQLKSYKKLKSRYGWSVKQILALAFRKTAFRFKMFVALALSDPESAKDVLKTKVKDMVTSSSPQ